MVKPRHPFANFPSANSAWISVGAPIVGLVTIIIVLAFALVAHFARQQDEAFVDSSTRLVENAMRERVSALKNIAIDFAVWNDAYAATRAWNERWLRSNYYSNVADGLFIISADGALRYEWVAEPHQPRRDSISQAITYAFDSTDSGALSARAAKRNVAFASFVTIDGQPAIFALAQIAPEGRPSTSQEPANYLAVLDVLSAADLSAAGDALDLSGLRFTTTAPDLHDAVAFAIDRADGSAIGAFTWRRDRPGSAAFVNEIWPIVLSLIVIGALTVLVARKLVSAHVDARVQSDSARESSRMKSEFIATMSHELRTPLNTIVGYTELMQEQAESLGENGKTISEDADHVLEGARHLGRLVSNILDQSRIDAGKLHLTSEAIEVDELLAELKELMQPLANTNDNRFSVSVEDNAGAVKADLVRIQQCLVNLTSNALKFTRAGEVRVTARRIAHAQGDMIAFDIQDTGAGIEPAELERLFQAFPTPSPGAGAGFSLSITRSLAQLMGGGLTARSRVGEGSTFTLTLPAKALAEAAV